MKDREVRYKDEILSVLTEYKNYVHGINQMKLKRLLCMLDMHGPNWLGAVSQERSFKSAPFVRTCTICGKKWTTRARLGVGSHFKGNIWREL